MAWSQTWSKRMLVCKLYWYGPVAGIFENANEPPDSIRGSNFITSLTPINFGRNSLHEIN